MFRIQVNQRIYNRAITVIPGGANSSENNFNRTGVKPVFFKATKGSRLVGATNKNFIDYDCAGGAMILGHLNPVLIKALVNQLKKGITQGPTSGIEIDVAGLIIKLIPGVRKVRMFSSGTEACTSALRLAQAFTGKNKIILFEGSGHTLTGTFHIFGNNAIDEKNTRILLNNPVSQTDDVLVAKYNNLAEVKAFFYKYPKDIAAIIVEPVAGNMGCILPADGFLEELRTICNDHGTLLIFDEINTGFRLSKGGAQELLNIRADMVIYGKVIGGGLPVGALAGKEEIMSMLAPEGNVYLSGDQSGNPLIMGIGFAVLKHLSGNPSVYKNLEEKTKQLVTGMKELFVSKNVPVTIHQIGSMFSLFFTNKEVVNFDSAKHGDNNAYRSFYKHLINNGIFFPPSPYKTCFVSNAHSDRDIRKTLRVIKRWKTNDH